MSWFTRWDESFDLSRGGIELSYRKHDDMNQLLVRTEATDLVDRIIEKMTTPLVSARCHIVGTRGFGKSTNLNYFAFRLFSELPSKRVLPVYASISGIVNDDKDLEFVFFKSLLEALFDVPTDIERFDLKSTFSNCHKQLNDANFDYKKQLQNFGMVSPEYVKTALKNQLEHFQTDFQKIVFLIDGLDKQKTEVVLKFLRTTQEELSNLIIKYNLMFIDSADPDWREVLGTKEFGGIRGTTISLRGWTREEVKALVENRLNRIGIYQIPFDQKALETLVEDFQGNPREILQYCTSLLHYGATEKIGTIGSGITRKVIWTDIAKEKFFKFVITDSDARYAFEKLKTIYDNRQMMNMLIATYTRKIQHLSRNLDYEERSSIGITVTDVDFKKFIEILTNRGCFVVETQNYVKLDDDLIKLFNFITFDIQESLIALPVVLGALEPKVVEAAQPPKEDISIKDEVNRIFEQHSNDWIDYEKCHLILLNNPKTRDLLKERYKEDYSAKITSILPMIVHDLLREGKLMKDEELIQFRWKPSTIDFEVADFFKSKIVLDLIESGFKAAYELDFKKLSIICEKLVRDSSLQLSNLAGNNSDISNVPKLIDFLKYVKVDTGNPVPLVNFMQSLKQPINNSIEANLYLQIAIVYSRRIYEKINYLNQFEPRNQQVISIIKKCKTGNSKIIEREFFKKTILPLLLKNYGAVVDSMTAIKLETGIIEKVSPLLEPLQVSGHLIHADVCRCPTCGKRFIVPSSTGSAQTNYCLEDKVPCENTGEGYILSQDMYQAWNVWLEEYVKCILEQLPFKYLETGVMLMNPDNQGIASPQEIDAIALLNGKLIAIECTEKIIINNERNDVANLVSKVSSLGMFDKIVIVYRQVNNQLAFNSELKKNEKIVAQVLVGNPWNVRNQISKIFDTT